MAAPFLILHHCQMQTGFLDGAFHTQYASPFSKYFMLHGATVRLYEPQLDRKIAICSIVIMTQCAKVQNVLHYIFALNMQQCTMQKKI